MARAWLRRGGLAALLWPFSLMYEGLFVLGQAWSRRRPPPVASPTAKVIVVGNVVAGGSGKTPVVMALVQHLQSRGVATGVISRGYGRLTTDCREVHATDPPAAAGDEPTLIKHATGAPVFVAAQRQQAADSLLQHYPQTRILLSDDGLQHQGLHRDLEICVFDDRGLGNGWLLPAGPLRERWPRPADLVLHTGKAPAFAGYRARRRLSAHAHRADGLPIDLNTFLKQTARPLLAIAGIAKPQEFFDMLHEIRGRPVETMALPDHYNFDSFQANEYMDYDLICTEKDAIKLWRRAPLALAVPLVLELDPDFLAAFDQCIDRLLGPPVSFGDGHTTS